MPRGFLARKATSNEGEDNVGNPILEMSEESGLFMFNDEIQVHGLQGHWRETWQHENGKVWLKDFLPGQLRDANVQARVMSFGYNADMASTKAVTGINDQAMMLLDRLEGKRLQKEEQNRPILFISHSLGGLIVKKLMILAWERDDIFGDLLRSISGVLFFGVPHRGSDIAFWAKFPVTIAKISSLGLRGNIKFLDALKRDSNEWREISNSFVGRGAHLRIRTFYETEKISGILVVDRESALLNLPNERAVGVADSDHRTICRFNRKDSQRYEPVWRAVVQMSQEVITVSSFDKSKASKEKTDEEVRCLQVLYAPNANLQRRQISVHVPGTCEWILQHPELIHWKREPSSKLLWISADPGWGKSVLASFLVDHFNSSWYQSKFPTTICSFFFRDDGDRQKCPTHAVRLILHQLFESKPSLVRYALPYFITRGDKFVEEFDTLWDILISSSLDEQCGNVICVFDGLDECDKAARIQLIHALALVQRKKTTQDTAKPRSSKSSLKFLLTCRPYMSIEDAFYDVPLSRLKGEDDPELNNSDVELVIRRKVYEFGKRRRLSTKTQGNLIDSLIQNADKTFLWVALVLEDLEKCSRASKGALEDLIRTLPATLDSLYEKVLQQASNFEDAKKILQLIATAKTPLSLDQMNDAFSLKFTETSYDNLDLEPSLETTIRDICGLFVRIVDSKIYFIHQTAKEFLIRVSSTNGTLLHLEPVWKQSIDIVESHMILARICMFYLELSDFGYGPLRYHINSLEYFQNQDEIEYYLKKYPLLEYAASYWDFHLRECHEPVELLRLSFNICNPTKERFCTWFNLSRYASAYQTSSTKPSALVLRSWMGHVVAVSSFLPDEMIIHEKDVHGSTALHRAAMSGNETLVSVLLGKGAEVDARDGMGLAALHLAAYYGYERMVAQLLEYGSSIDSICFITPDLQHDSCVAGADGGWTALHIAVVRSNYAVVQLLLEKGANVHFQGPGGRTPLHLTALTENLSIPELLLNYGAQIESRDSHMFTQMHLAAFTGNESLVRFLVEKGANLRSKDVFGRSPLHCAVSGGNTTLFRLIFSTTFVEGVTGNATNFETQFASKFRAKKYGQPDEVYSHIRAMDSIAILSRFGWVANHQRVKDTHVEVVQLLIDSGADIEARTNAGVKALHIAAESQRSSLVELLVRSGANIHAKQNGGNTAMHMVMKFRKQEIQNSLVWGNEEIMDVVSTSEILRILLENGANINSENNDGQTTLHLAAAQKSEVIVKQLLESGSKVLVQDSLGRTPLHDAVLRVGHKFRTCKNLDCPFESTSQHMDNCNFNGGNGDDTDYEGKEDAHSDESEDQVVQRVMQMLCDYGADVNSKDNDSYTALHLAAGGRDSLVLEWLLQRGADVNSMDNNRRRPLHLAVDKPGKTREDFYWQDDQKPAVRTLLHHGAHIDAQDNYGRTALHIAAATKEYFIVKMLLSRGANVNLPNNHGETPLHSAIRTSRSDSVLFEYLIFEIVNVLLDYGAKPELMDFAGRTAQDLAKLLYLKEVVKILQLITPDCHCCESCGEPLNNKRCRGCYLVGYCSKDCQIADWPKHRKDCKLAQKRYVEL